MIPHSSLTKLNGGLLDITPTFHFIFKIWNNFHTNKYSRLRPELKGLPSKDETSKTFVKNLNCLFPYIYDSLQL